MKQLRALFDAKLWKFLLVGVINTLVGTAITGHDTSPPTTLASAPSMPAIAITTRAPSSTSRCESNRCNPATPTSYSRVTRLPSASAVRAASSATGISLVPPVAIAILPTRSIFFGAATPTCDVGS